MSLVEFMDKKIVAMFIGLLGGCYLYLFLGNWAGVTDLPLDSSTLLPILGVVTFIFVFMVLVYKISEDRVP
ncbi:hypothetical protein [Halolamina salifodinae]|uniref:Uncharacterized protein n=1 Tax=Halolamina salifodinae TaxID=1202767 RepID=A0A8T4GYI7_9EURY|nr:hypothetical protein [Halolamina salifodinae]MBP1988056.1 hypothetical protein [Halolamina salifodinae]